MINKSNSEKVSLNLSKDENRIMKHIRLLQFMGISISLVGVGSVMLGIYSVIFRPMSSGESQILHSLILYSVGFVVGGWMYYRMARLVERLKDLLNLEYRTGRKDKSTD